MQLLPPRYQQALFGTTDPQPTGEDFGIVDNRQFYDLPVGLPSKPIDETLEEFAASFWQPWRERLESHLVSKPAHVRFINRSLQTSVWVRMSDDTAVQPEDLPDTFTFDFEAVKVGELYYPICVVLVGNEDTYYWLSPSVPQFAVPFRGGSLGLGWNVSYDRQYLEPELRLEDSGNRFIDGMALATAMYGISSQQRAPFEGFQRRPPGSTPKWYSHASSASLAEVHKFVTGVPLDKSTRYEITQMQWGDWWGQRFEILDYCYKDVLATKRLMKQLYTRYNAVYCHNPITWVGLLEMSNTIVPLSAEWMHFVQRGTKAYDAIKDAHDRYLRSYSERFLADESAETYPDLDWTPKTRGANAGKPKWWAKVLENEKLSLGLRAAPLILGLRWKGDRLLFQRTWWGGSEALPHLEKPGANLGTPFVADYIYFVERGDLTSVYLSKEQLLQLYRDLSNLSNWKSFSKRYRSLRVSPSEHGFTVVPQTVVMGTQSRRAKDSVWLVSVKPSEDVIGSEFRLLVQAPIGWRIVGADMDSEESWLASLLGDMYGGKLGSCAFSRAVLVGDKDDKTDIHNLMAQRVNTDRSTAKTMNFAGQYLCGMKRMANQLAAENPDGDLSEFLIMSAEYISSNRGVKENGVYEGGVASEVFNAMIKLGTSPGTCTPALSHRIPESLDQSNTGKDFLTTKVNWSIQSFGVDVMHTFICCMAMLRGALRYRLMLTIHDEFKYLSPTEEAKATALLFQQAHLYTKAYIYKKCGFDNMPAAQAWFSSVEIDTRHRKDVKELGITPTNPKGYAATGIALKPRDYAI